MRCIRAGLAWDLGWKGFEGEGEGEGMEAEAASRMCSHCHEWFSFHDGAVEWQAL